MVWKAFFDRSFDRKAGQYGQFRPIFRPNSSVKIIFDRKVGQIFGQNLFLTDINRSKCRSNKVLTENKRSNIRSKLFLTEKTGQKIRSKYFVTDMFRSQFRSKFFDRSVTSLFRPLFFRPLVFGQNFGQKGHFRSKLPYFSVKISVKISCFFCSELLRAY